MISAGFVFSVTLYIQIINKRTQQLIRDKIANPLFHLKKHFVLKLTIANSLSSLI